jgi:hypothetical protein
MTRAHQPDGAAEVSHAVVWVTRARTTTVEAAR